MGDTATIKPSVKAQEDVLISLKAVPIYPTIQHKSKVQEKPTRPPLGFFVEWQLPEGS